VVCFITYCLIIHNHIIIVISNGKSYCCNHTFQTDRQTDRQTTDADHRLMPLPLLTSALHRCQQRTFKKNTNYSYDFRISILLGILSEIFIQIGYFLSRVSILTRDIDKANLSVRPSVRYVPVLYENGLTRCHFFPYGSPIILVYEHQPSSRNYDGVTLCWEINTGGVYKFRDFLPCGI